MRAFPEQGTLKILIKIALNENLDEIAGGQNLSDITFNLIGWVESHGRLKEFIYKARYANPHDEDLRRFVEQHCNSSEVPSEWNIGIIPQNASDEGDDHRNLAALLKRVKQFWIDGMLRESLRSTVRIDIKKSTLPEAVSHPLNTVIELPGHESQEIPPGRDIASIFEANDRALLILGPAGSGKTVALLELAQSLASRATINPYEPIPVIFHLSSWAVRRQPMLDWLSAELAQIYFVPKKLGINYLEQNRLLLLLDGLDEMDANYRADCIAAINTFRSEYGVAGMVVCCRLDDYKAMMPGVRLRLRTTVCLHALSEEQIDAVLVRGGPQMAVLRATLQQDAVLREEAQSPLMLEVMSLAYQGLDAEDLAKEGMNSPEARRKHIFDRYIERMFTRKGQADDIHQKSRVLKSLSWLADNMRHHAQSVFLVERLQPSWLSSRWQLLCYMLGSRVVIGLLLNLVLFGPLLVLIEGWGLSAIGGAIAGITAGIVDTIRTIQDEKGRLSGNKTAAWKAICTIGTYVFLGGLAWTSGRVLLSLLLEEGQLYGTQDASSMNEQNMRYLIYGMVWGLLSACVSLSLRKWNPDANKLGASIKVCILTGIVFGFTWGLIILPLGKLHPDTFTSILEAMEMMIAHSPLARFAVDSVTLDEIILFFVIAPTFGILSAIPVATPDHPSHLGIDKSDFLWKGFSSGKDTLQIAQGKLKKA